MTHSIIIGGTKVLGKVVAANWQPAGTLATNPSCYLECQIR